MQSSTTRVDTTVLDAAAMLAIAMGSTPGPAPGPVPQRPRVVADAVVGTWRSRDGAIKLHLRTDGTYAGEVAGRRKRPSGTYRIDGDAVMLHDAASGLHTPVTVRQHGELEMAGHRLLPA
ncbi:Atu4866 domain-containing protein [Actinoplanes teichomyceticus]|uniref:Putative ligand-binding protein with streptavidin-like fold n=1 Tax=Actinoplanes teichomyceticus TaxID=1867 RepID=A0A561WSJ5_ACTTI|nr:Atu4866 domain-containing protein [Actinoplanes teichomyceticus]TWG26816.1 putative ligand-binding protein with streptavidin-like fold [Actinoplanes teichomyceticus]GIF15215.1 hypothetical protein Ate01nite_52470 [Actinoplanes teichomyceticus]